MQFNGHVNELLLLSELSSANCHLLKESVESDLTMVWLMDDNCQLNIDGIDYKFRANEIICLTEFHKVKVKSIGQGRLVRFNRPFYCISDHDSEVGCKGILFFGASEVPRICIKGEELEKFEILWKMFSIEMESKDKLQIEMLQMMLKRLIILVTRLYKEQHEVTLADKGELDVVREFNYLVENNFKEKRTVAEYADMLFKSPKTLSNLFLQYNEKSPKQIIQDRIMIEARRLLSYSDMPIKEIAYELGYEDIQSFSRFFKAQEQMSPSKFRNEAVAEV